MNLVAKEYVAAQSSDDPGALVLSEFAGAAQELLGAIVVNPYDAKAVADAIAAALDMPLDRRREAMRAMQQRVREFDAQAWARAFIGDLDAHRPAVAQRDKSDLHELAERLASTLRRTDSRVAMFLDYDGTLREIERDPAAARPNDAVLALLDRFARQRNLDVTIISGRTAQDLESFFGKCGFGLVAEHGASLRRPNDSEWTNLDRNGSYRWRDEIVKVLRLYEASTPGSFIEIKRTSVVWHYRRSDAEFGSWKAKQLVEELGALTASEPIQVRHGHKMVEVVATHISKAAAIQHILENKSYDLILIAGDDVTDESRFRLDAKNLFTIKVGEGDTRAKFRVRSPDELRRFLQQAMS